MVDKKVELGEWAGLCKYDSEMEARKVRPCSVCVVKMLPEGLASDEVLRHAETLWYCINSFFACIFIENKSNYLINRYLNNF